MTFDEYEALAMSTADYPNKGENMVYPAMGLAGEGGEFCDKIKKFWRNYGSMSGVNLTPEQKAAALKELGDPLWYIAAAARELGSSLEDVAVQNIAKLGDRRTRGVIKSEGDDR